MSSKSIKEEVVFPSTEMNNEKKKVSFFNDFLAIHVAYFGNFETSIFDIV